MSYFFIKSRLSEFVLDISGGYAIPGTPVIVWSKSEEKDNQKWRFDEATGTIRSKLNDLVLDISDETLIVNNYEAGKQDQQWQRVDEEKLLNIVDPRFCIDVYEADESEGARVIKYPFYETINQLWDFEAAAREQFFIQSQLNDLVATIKETSAGTFGIVTADKDPSNHKDQLFYEDAEGYIRSVANELAVTAQKGQSITLTAGGTPSSRWKFVGCSVQSVAGDVFDITGARKEAGTAVCAWENNNQSNQAWTKVVAV